MTTLLLNESSPKINHPKSLKIKLKEHQLTTIHEMNRLEQTGEVNRTISSVIHKFEIYANPNIHTDYYNRYWLPDNLKTYKDLNYKIQTNFGILGDIVGSGKTYMILGLLNHNLVPIEHDKFISSGVFSCLSYKDIETTFKTNLIIVPHNLVSQWKQAFSYCNLKTHIISKRSDINVLKYDYNLFKEDDMGDLDDLDGISQINCVEYYDVIICSATMIDEFLEKWKNIKYARIVIDEVCSIRLPAELSWNANFIWFITATPSGIQYLKKYYIRDIVNNRMHQFIFNNIIVKNDDEYVGKSMSLPHINQILIKCFTPKQLEIVREFIPNDVMDMLNAGDVQGAVLKLNCNIDTNENILQVLTNKIQKEIHNKKAELTYQESIIPTDKKVHDETVKKLRDKVNSLEDKYNSIKNRVTEFNKDSCSICLEEYKNTTPAIVPCCNNLFCINCLTQLKGSCPLCRNIFTMDKIHIISDSLNKNNKNKQDKSKVNEISKTDALIKILKEKPNGKFLLFSNYEQTFENLNKKLSENNIKFSKLIGSGAVVNKTIERFKSGEIKVLMLNALHYGSGLNLQMASDIIIYHQLSLELETQVIGRAQRLGRNEPLNVYYLLHEHEVNNVSNPVLSLDLSIDGNLEELDKHLHGKTIINVIPDVNSDLSSLESDDEHNNIRKNKNKNKKTKEKKSEKRGRRTYTEI